MTKWILLWFHSVAQRKVFSVGSWRKMFAGAKCFVRQAGIGSGKMQLGSCWVIGPITRGKEDRRYSTWKGLWTGKGPQEEQCTQLQLRRQLWKCTQQATVPLRMVANFLTKDGCRFRCFSHQHSTSNVERSAHLGQHTWECHVCLRMPEMDN